MTTMFDLKLDNDKWTQNITSKNHVSFLKANYFSNNILPGSLVKIMSKVSNIRRVATFPILLTILCLGNSLIKIFNKTFTHIQKRDLKGSILANKCTLKRHCIECLTF